MPTYVPGAEEILGPALARVGQAINNIVEPDWEMKKAFQAHLAQNPELVQQLADMESRNPGTLNSEMFRRILNPSTSATLAGLKPSTGESATEALDANLAAMQPEQRQRFLAGLALKMKPSEFVREGRVAAGGVSPAVVQAGAESAVSGGKTATQLAHDELQRHILEAQSQLVDERVAGLPALRTYLQGLPEEQRIRTQAFMADPTIMQDVHFWAGQDLQERLLQLRLDERANENEQRRQDRRTQYGLQHQALLDRFNEETARSWFQDTHVGTLQGWIQYALDPEAATKPEYSQYRAALDAMDAPKRSAMLVRNNAAIANTLSVIRGEVKNRSVSAEERPRAIETINSYLRQNAQVDPGAPRITASWYEPTTPINVGPIHANIPGRGRVIFTDATGHEVDPNNYLSRTDVAPRADPEELARALTGPAAEARRRIQATPENLRPAAIARLRVQQPDLYGQVAPTLGISP